MTLLPGLIDAHTHVLLHPYNEATWDDQVLREPLALRVCRATNHLARHPRSGFTTIRDLGTEGAGYADVGLKQAVEQGIVPGPRMLVVTRAIVATGSYGPAGFAPEWSIPRGPRRPTASTTWCGSCATRSAAGPTGSSAPGRLADLVAVEGDPTRENRALAGPRPVGHEGRHPPSGTVS